MRLTIHVQKGVHHWTFGTRLLQLFRQNGLDFIWCMCNSVRGRLAQCLPQLDESIDDRLRNWVLDPRIPHGFGKLCNDVRR